MFLHHTPWLFFGFVHGGIDYCWCFLPCSLRLRTMALTLAPFSNAHRASWYVSLGVHFTPNDANGSPHLELHAWAGSQRPETVCGSHVDRGWKTTTPGDCSYSLCFLGTNMTHTISCPGVSCAGNDACPEGFWSANITRLIRKGFLSKLKPATKEHGKREG